MSDERAKAEPRLVSYIVSPPVRKAMQDPTQEIALIICLTEDPKHPESGVNPSKAVVKARLHDMGVPDRGIRESDFYLFVKLRAPQIEDLAQLKEVWQIWMDETCQAHLLSSVETVKASACWRTFEARGNGITWAVLDSGISYDHPHFARYGNIDRTLSKNFSSSSNEEDVYGHGTHVAGIIAGSAPPNPLKPFRQAFYLENADEPRITDIEGCVSGIAPMAKLVNVKVLNDDGSGSASTCILGLEYIRKMNQNSRQIKVDGANISLGYPFDPKWYGCGHTPLCEEIRRAVESGIVVVVSAGNSGYGTTRLDSGAEAPVYVELSIEDPANAEEAICVGSVHKAAPHTFGVSYFSSKGPTGDGRMKPDLVAPGEKIISASTHWNHPDPGSQYEYEEKSGTSMAAPHVSGAIAAFLSVHREFRRNPTAIKHIFLKSATDLRRQPGFQGAGLVDPMRAIMSI